MRHLFLTPTATLKLAIGLLWLLLFALLLRREVFVQAVDLTELQTMRQAAAEEYLSVSFKGEKVGYVHYRYTPIDDEKWQLEQVARMSLLVAGREQPIDMRLQAVLTGANQLREFTFTFHTPFYQMSASGEATASEIRYRLDTGANTITDRLSLNAPPLLATSRRAYLLEAGLAVGDKRRIPWFDPFSLSGRESVLEYRGVESLLINGRVQRLHHFVESFAGMRVNSWLDESGVVVKEESPAGFVFQKEPKFKALADTGGSAEVQEAVAVQISGAMPAGFGQQMRYRLSLPAEASFDLDGGRQRFADGVLTLSQEDMPVAGQQSGKTCTGPVAEASLAATPYVQSDHSEITALSQQIIAGLDTPLAKARALGQWVHDNIAKRPVIGLPDALTTLRDRQGDCNEHAALFAALARAAGLPTEIVAGVTWHRGAFYYHAWNELCIAGQWLSIDSTTNQFPADLGHLRFVTGEMQEQVRLGALLGTLRIEPLPAEP